MGLPGFWDVGGFSFECQASQNARLPESLSTAECTPTKLQKGQLMFSCVLCSGRKGSLGVSERAMQPGIVEATAVCPKPSYDVGAVNWDGIQIYWS